MEDTGKVLLASLDVDLTPSQCGIPILCPGKQAKFRDLKFLPSSLVDLDIKEDLTDLISRANKIFHATELPLIPFWLPFRIYERFMNNFRSIRLAQLEALLEDFNTRKCKHQFRVHTNAK